MVDGHNLWKTDLTRKRRLLIDLLFVTFFFFYLRLQALITGEPAPNVVLIIFDCKLAGKISCHAPNLCQSGVSVCCGAA